jgi:hypothetical protein
MTGGRLAPNQTASEVTMFRRSFIAAAALVAVVPSAVRADQWETQVRVQMIGAVGVAASHGYALREQVQLGSLRQGQAMVYNIDFSRYRDYVLVANCDADCGDVDLVLTEPDGREVLADRAFDDQAVLLVPASHKGDHKLRVSMANCRRGPCRFGVGVFTK